ncbi:S8 family serine peptidase, partial [Methanolobus profundi]
MNLKTVIFISIIIILLSPMTVYASDSNTIYLKAGNIDTDKIASQNTSEQNVMETSSTSETLDNSEKYYIVQFDGPVTEEWKDTVENMGAEFFDYVPDNAFVLRMNGTEKTFVGSLEFVHWSGEFLPEYKYTDEVVTTSAFEIASGSEDILDIIVLIFDEEGSDKVTTDIIGIGGTIIGRSERMFRVQILATKIDEIVSIDEVCWVENYKQLTTSNDVASDIVNVNTVHNTSGLNGSGQIIAICDTGLDTGNKDTVHLDIRGRIDSIIDLGYGAQDTNGHGTHVTGSALGNGAMSDGQYAGMAPEASLVFQAAGPYLEGIPTNIDQIFQQAYDEGARIHSNSWGADTDGAYDYYSYRLDQFSWNNPDMLILMAAGNEGEDIDPADGVVDKDSINTPATAKNCIAVGSSENYRPDMTYMYGGTIFSELPIFGDYKADNISGMAATSSRGPTDDGRFKPDIVAPGTLIYSTKSSYTSGTSSYLYMSGTSMATPIVAGSAAIIREYYTDIENVADPSAALLKATLLNGAYDMTPGQYGEGTTQEISGRPDNSQGWGRVDVENSILVTYPEVIAYYDDISLETDESWSHPYNYLESDQPARATLVWTDHPSLPYENKTLINDLDLTIIGPSATYYGNNGPDHINNVEGVEIDSTVEGDYTVTIDGYSINYGPQPFALVFSFTCDNNEFPANGSSASTSMTIVSTDVVHPGGVDESSIEMTVDGASVTFTSTDIDDGYEIEYQTPGAYQAGVHHASVTASTITGQQFTYGWEFNVGPEITSFGLTSPVANTVIDNLARTIELSVPYGTDTSYLEPAITHNAKSVAPASGEAQDFTNPVTYTVTAEDGSTEQYTVTVDIEPNTEKEITSFKFTSPAVTGTIDQTAKTIEITVPYGTDVTTLTPTISHTGQTIAPLSGAVQDFTNPVTYTVTAED